MKTRDYKKQAIVLLLAGALATGTISCTSSNDDEVVNNTFVTNLGYYHASFGGFFPYPFNYYVVGRGYYAGGFWYGNPYRITVIRSIPRSTVVVYHPLPNIPPPAPRVIVNRTFNTTNTTTINTRVSTPVSTPAHVSSPSTHVGGFGSTGSSSGS